MNFLFSHDFNLYFYHSFEKCLFCEKLLAFWFKKYIFPLTDSTIKNTKFLT